jgi:uncharacterized delta-60 repeat protein
MAALAALRLLSPCFAAADITIDAAFGRTGGMFFLKDERFVASSGFAVAVQDDGKIMVAGNGKNGKNSDILILRLTPDGRPDATFGTSGMFLFDKGRDDLAYALGLRPDGGIVVAGSSRTDRDVDVVVLVLKASGERDRRFGNNGMACIDIGGGSIDHGINLLLTAGGSVMVGGWTQKNGNKDLFVMALTAAGEKDPSFGTDGLYRYDRGGNETGMALASATGGRILAAGYGGGPEAPYPLALELSKAGESVTVYKPYEASHTGMIFDIGVHQDGDILWVGNRPRGESSSVLPIFYTRGTTLADAHAPAKVKGKGPLSHPDLVSTAPSRDKGFWVAGGLAGDPTTVFVGKVDRSERRDSPYFSPDGRANGPLAHLAGVATGMAVQPDGKVLVCGWCKIGTGDAATMFVTRIERVKNPIAAYKPSQNKCKCSWQGAKR